MHPLRPAFHISTDCECPVLRYLKQKKRFLQGTLKWVLEGPSHFIRHHLRTAYPYPQKGHYQSKQSMVTSTVLSITKQDCFEFLCRRFFSVIYLNIVYSIQKILIYIHATFWTTSRPQSTPNCF